MAKKSPKKTSSSLARLSSFTVTFVVLYVVYNIETNRPAKLVKTNTTTTNRPLESTQYSSTTGNRVIKLADLSTFLSNRKLTPPDECSNLRNIAWKPSKLTLYKKDFSSQDYADWFLYTSIFDEKWHAQQVKRGTRPVYLDIAANHARKWSTTWFFDRCLGWDGVCVEPNNIYWDELQSNRTCHLVPKCVSDIPRDVNFSYAAAYGGVASATDGIDAEEQRTQKKGDFSHVATIRCTTVSEMLSQLNTQFSHVNLLSLDVERHELPVLLGIDWSAVKIDVIITEGKSGPVIQLLKSHNFELFPNIVKDHLWIRKGSGLSIDPQAIARFKSLNPETKRFPGYVADDDVMPDAEGVLLSSSDS